MKKRVLSMLLALIMVLGLIPVNAFAAGKTVSQYFDGLPVTADPGTGTTAWKVGTKDGQEVLLSGSAGKSYSTSTLTLTFTEDSHLSFAYQGLLRGQVRQVHHQAGQHDSRRRRER